MLTERDLERDLMRVINEKNGGDVGNSTILVKVGMALTAHKTVATFIRYLRTEDKPEREAVELVASQRKVITGAKQIPARATG